MYGGRAETPTATPPHPPPPPTPCRPLRRLVAGGAARFSPSFSSVRARNLSPRRTALPRRRRSVFLPSPRTYQSTDQQSVTAKRNGHRQLREARESPKEATRVVTAKSETVIDNCLIFKKPENHFKEANTCSEGTYTKK